MREYSRECVAAAARARDVYNANISQAWNSIYFLSKAMGPKGLPDLKTQFAKEPGETQKPVPMAVQAANFYLFAAHHNLTPRPISQAAKDAIRRMKAQMNEITPTSGSDN